MKKYLLLIIAAAAVFCGCTKEFEVTDSNYLTGKDAIKMVEADPSFLSSYVNGMYAYMVQYNTQNNAEGPHDDYGYLSSIHMCDLMCQDVAICGSLNWGTYDIPHGYGSEMYSHTFQHWNFFYTLIAKANEIIDFFGTEDPQDVTLKGYLGQAYAIRALSYLYLIQFYQDMFSGEYPNATIEYERAGVPIIYASRDNKTSEMVEQRAGRNTVEDVCLEIEDNITKATALLEGFVPATDNEISSSVLNAIAARYYLLTQQYQKAKEAAVAAQVGYTVVPQSEVLTNGFMEVTDPEVIWGFSHNTETATVYASFFSHTSNYSPGYGGYGQSVHCASKALYDLIPVSDVRKEWFNNPDGSGEQVATGGQVIPYANKKFGYMADWLQDYVYIRVEEMILIEAECEVRLGNGGLAATALSRLMSERDKTWYKPSATLDDVLLQRRIELWSEGFEYFDLRRTCQGAIRKYEGSNHKETNQMDFPAHDSSWNYQIPLREIQNNTHITEEEQNEYVDPSE